MFTGDVWIRAKIIKVCYLSLYIEGGLLVDWMLYIFAPSENEMCSVILLILAVLSPAAPEHMLCVQNGRYDHADRMFNR